MSEHRIPSGTVKFVAGALCLDFANTLGGRDAGRPLSDRLTGYDDLVAWSHRAGLLSDAAARHLPRVATRRPEAAGSAMARALALRETIYAVFSAAAAGRTPGRRDLDRLNREVGESLSRLGVARAATGFIWRWRDDAEALDKMLWPIARSAAELLTGPDLGLVRECGGETCGWLFVDTTKNRSRRWCEMKVCGNRAKARRHHARHRAMRPPSAG